MKKNVKVGLIMVVIYLVIGAVFHLLNNENIEVMYHAKSMIHDGIHYLVFGKGFEALYIEMYNIVRFNAIIACVCILATTAIGVIIMD